MTFKESFKTSLRVAAALLFGLAAVETLGFALLDIPLSMVQLSLALALGAAAALLWAVLSGALARFAAVSAESAAKLTNLTVALSLPFVLAVIWLNKDYFGLAGNLYLAAAILLLAVFFAGLGRVLWTYLDRGDRDLASARFMALGPAAVGLVGVFSALWEHYVDDHLLAVAAVFLLAVLPVIMYGLVRLLWGRRRRRVRRLEVAAQLIALLAVPLVALSGAAVELSKSHRKGEGSLPPVVLISIDTLRADHLSSYNPDAPPTPHMDALANDGVLFEHPVAPSSWTGTSISSFLTGLYPTAAGAGQLDPRSEYGVYSGPMRGAVTIAERLAERGYRTIGITSNQWLTPDRNFDQGFQEYTEFLTDTNVPRPRFLLVRACDFFTRPLRKPKSQIVRQTQLATGAIERMAGGPFFLWLHYIEPHVPYIHHPEFPVEMEVRPLAEKLIENNPPYFVVTEAFEFGDRDREFFRRRYGQEVRYTDMIVGRVIDKLKEEGVYDESLIVLTADHGEELWDHGGFEHAHSFHGEVINVPLIVKLPGNRGAGARVSSWVSIKRIGRTMFDALGIDDPFPGESLLPCLDNGACPGSMFWFSEHVMRRHEKGAVGDDLGHKAIIHQDYSFSCYDLNVDPAEKNPLPLDRCGWPGDALPPLELFKRINAENLATMEMIKGLNEDQQISEKDLRGLRSLGYIP